jgi:apolipoprotein N-acyltransferase
LRAINVLNVILCTQMKMKNTLALSIFIGLSLGMAQSFQATSLFSLLLVMAFLNLLARTQKLTSGAVIFFTFTLSYLIGAAHWIGLGIYRPPVNGLIDSIFIWVFAVTSHACIHTGVYAVISFVGRCAGLKKNLGQLIALALGWPLAELLRSMGSWAMPWGLLGYGQIDNPLFKGLYPVIGGLGVSGAMWLFAALMLALVRSLGLLYRHFRDDLRAHYVASSGVLFAGALLTFTLAYISQWIEFTNPTEQQMHVRTVHTHWKNEVKHTPEIQAVSLAQLESYSQLGGADLTLFPELYLLLTSGQISQQIRSTIVSNIRDNSTAMIFGTLGIAPTNDGAAGNQNTMVMLDSQGATTVYAKEILLPFSEHLPNNPLMVWAYDFLYRYPQADFVAGPRNQTPFNVRGIVLGTSICSELAYAGKASRQAKNANVLINPSSDSWIDSGAYLYQAHTIARVRAAEAQKPMVRPNNVGISAFIDYRGNVLSQQVDVPESGVMNVQPRVGNTPYVLFAVWLDDLIANLLRP